MNPESRQKLDRFFAALLQASAALLMLDYDGTLAPFRIDRFQARPWSGVRHLLNLIQAGKKTRLVVVTGRPAHEIGPLLALDAPVEVWGLHGAERLFPDGRHQIESAPPEARARLDELCERLSRRDPLGGLFEHKPNAAVMHWRGASPRIARQIERRTRALFEPLARLEGLRLLEFECGLELRAGRDKGGAVSALLDEVNNGRKLLFPAAYLGDDITDESAFAAIRSRGLSVLVRRGWRQTQADVWLCPPVELRRFLAAWLAATSPHPAVSLPR